MRWNARTIGIAAAVIIVLAASGFIVARSGPAFGQSFTIGYVDMAKAVEGHPKKASAEAALKDYAQAQIADAQQRMKTMTPEQQAETRSKVNQDLVKKRQELLGPLEKDIRAAIEKVARSQGIAIVLSRDVVLYGGVDLTDQVIKAISGK
ncbi:MAG: OmpH family outer membrane protein [Bacillati bacterium ANGP1]|uniref:OmpH family outer membrane protein n=1 Tax=Candidatus Segetimicrobium genomatis TaxID=2569760 RepID=A0A537JJU8_9BACT|nr:MAG: OmpH family outer membrane protein [Terrabacteria group bacterium ANGP1]